MAAGKYNFELEQGATFSRQITWKDSTGTPINLTGYTVTGSIRKSFASNSTIASFTCTNANQGSSPGVFTLSLTATQTALLPVKNSASPSDRDIQQLPYIIEATTGSTVYRLLEGTISVSAR